MIPFKCVNNKYQTDTGRGYSHGPGTEKGSFFPEAIRITESGSLWIEYVAFTDGTATDGFWFVWYDTKGRCLTASSAVFTSEDLAWVLSGIVKGVI